MIKNARQYRTTKAAVRKFQSALEELSKAQARDSNAHPLFYKVQEAGLRDQLNELLEQLHEYEELRSSKRKAIQVKSLEDLPYALIRARIALGLNQKDLADRLGLKEQQIQRYEATEYSSANLARVMEVARVLGIQISKDLSLPVRKITLGDILPRLNKVGLDPDLVVRRLVTPPQVVSPRGAENGRRTKDRSDTSVLRILSNVRRVFGWTPSAVVTGAPLELIPAAIGSVRYKVRTSVDERRLNAYTVYAHFLARQVLLATSGLSSRTIPTDAKEFREVVVSAYGSVSFENVLKYAWDVGIPVVPLRDRGAFHAACLRLNGRNVIVLKQWVNYPERWLFDLLHEFSHAGWNPNVKDFAFIDVEESEVDPKHLAEEQEASEFAGNVILAGRAEQLAELCVQAASGKVEFLKRAVPQVAARENVATSSLANYLAFRLSLQGINWWGAANNLQETGKDPWRIAREYLFPRVEWDRLQERDRQLLVQALSE